MQILERNQATTDSFEEQPQPRLTSQPPLIVLSPPRFPYGPMATSLLFHAIVFLLLSFVRLPGKRSSLVDFEHERITFYRVSEEFPDISPLLMKTQPVETGLGDADRPDSSQKFRRETEVAIKPGEKDLGSFLLDQPQQPKVSTLPRLELPNILMNRLKSDPGEEPISVTHEVDRDVNRELKQKMAELSPSLELKPNISDPLPMQQSPHLEGQTLKSSPVAALASPQLNLALPVEPPTVTPQVSQIENRAKSFGAGAPLFIGPIVDEPEGNGTIEQLPSPAGANVLVYSSHPSLPKGELRVPKVNAAGTINASPQGGSGTGAGRGAPEFGNASIVIPGVSIKNRVPLLDAGTGVAVVQAPKPLPPIEEKKEEKKIEETPPVKNLLPPHGSLKLPSLEDSRKTLGSESPLQEVERQGKQIYTASMNAPNFTSKRGSWIFRFAELSDFSPGADSVPQLNGLTEAPLTAPSAIVKVDPRYSPQVIRDKVEGVVVLYAILRKDGTVDPESVRLVRKLDPRLELSAKEALLHWKFKPSQKNGKPVDIQAEVSIPFYFHREPFYP